MRRTALVVAILGLSLTGCAGQQGPIAGPADAPSTPAVVESSLQAFELDTSPAAMVAFPDNKLIVEGAVQGEGERRVVTPKASGGDLWYVYRPVYLTVTAVHRGNAKVGDVIALRVIGGEATGRRTVYHHAPPDSTYATGKKLLVFGVGKVDAGDGVVAVTPNATYVLQGNKAVDAAEPTHEVSVQSIRSQLQVAAKGR